MALATRDMIPDVWLLTPQQERQWASQAAALTQAPPERVRRLVVIELPDCPLSWRYHEMFAAASASRDDLITPMISPWDQWESRQDLATLALCLLLSGRPPVAVFAAIAVLDD